MRSGLLAGIRWSVCMLKSHRSLCESFSRTGAGLCIYHLFVWSNWNFLHISQWITLPTQSCLALYSFCANLLHSLIMWLIVSSLSPHSLHLLFCCVLSILIGIVIFLGMSLNCTRWWGSSLEVWEMWIPLNHYEMWIPLIHHEMWNPLNPNMWNPLNPDMWNPLKHHEMWIPFNHHEIRIPINHHEMWNPLNPDEMWNPLNHHEIWNLLNHH